MIWNLINSRAAEPGQIGFLFPQPHPPQAGAERLIQGQEGGPKRVHIREKPPGLF
jgi:hypothetical protein